MAKNARPDGGTASSLALPMQEVSQEVLLEKYCKGEEATKDEIFERVARGLAAVEKEGERETWRSRFLNAMQAGFIPAGRVLSACGTGIQATLINCFVQPVGDSVSTPETDDVSGKQFPSIYQAARQAAETLRRGGGVGYNFSRIRPKGAYVKATASRASGPLSYMRVFDVSCDTVESAGARRGAQMGILNVSHPDIMDFIHAKKKGEFSRFNLSVGVSDEFMGAVMADGKWALTHRAAPDQRNGAHPDAYRRGDGLWVYQEVRARDVWDAIMRSTYEIGEPGIQFFGRIASENPLYYAEEIACTNPCSEQPLPNFGCCCLGSIDLTRFVTDPFTENAGFDYEGLREVAKVATRMLDNVLDVTYWPLDEQREEAMNKRRIGLGFTGLGDALIMLGIHYGSEKALTVGATIAAEIRDAAYATSAGLAAEKGAFPLFDAEKHLAGAFIQRLPSDIRDLIAAHGLRNSHLLSIAPTGTISLALADNASNGIEPPFSLSYQRRKRNLDGGWDTHQVRDHAFRVWTEQLGNQDQDLPGAFQGTALKISVAQHRRMMEVVQPFVDAAISKTVNVPEDYPFEDFKAIYLDAWQGGLKSIATYRPNTTLGAILSETDAKEPDANASATAAEPVQGEPEVVIEAMDWMRLKDAPPPPLSSLRTLHRPTFMAGNPARTYMLEVAGEGFAVTIGETNDGEAFEVWVMGNAPRGIAALSKNLSMDLRSRDRSWLERKLQVLLKTGGESIEVAFPPDGEPRRFPGVTAAFAGLIDYHCRAAGAFAGDLPTPLVDGMLMQHERPTGGLGTVAWSMNVVNANTKDDLAVFIQELMLPGGARRPYSVRLSGDYPRALDGLAKSLSLDMRVFDPSWIGRKLRQLTDFSEPLGDFFAPIPGDTQKSKSYPSTTAYIANVLRYRYNRLGILDVAGFPMGVGAEQEDAPVDLRPSAPTKLRAVGAMEVSPGKRCDECGNYSLIKKDGCDYCTSCGAIGSCG